ncbi:uncharacterized protein KD926_000953 [Aspergillus affinis]|uniref:uncharacterized protein n=1 Tax=Aspergillus affinis TaxID=1070780 RepID=UPI0022FEAF8A|nr:uncharacterized protein KD926_000953 [Aspergillus affinis]KAI9044352.1 hypothetical protein KD926_000953 [Aspergillus affinis]
MSGVFHTPSDPLRSIFYSGPEASQSIADGLSRAARGAGNGVPDPAGCCARDSTDGAGDATDRVAERGGNEFGGASDTGILRGGEGVVWHVGLVEVEVEERLERSSYAILDLGAECFVGEGFRQGDDPQDACAPYITVGYDATGCEGYLCNKPVCCPPEIEQEIDLGDCVWRGSADCHGQCTTGYVQLAQSTWDESTAIENVQSNCKTGSKALCCYLRSYGEMFAGCYHTPGFGYPCVHDYISIAHFWNPWIPWKNGRPEYGPGEDLCCPMSSPLPFINCHWVGDGDCMDANCAASEVTLSINAFGGDGESCIGARLKSLCCTPNFAVLDGMAVGIDGFCLEDPYGCEDGEYDDNEDGEYDDGDEYFT